MASKPEKRYRALEYAMQMIPHLITKYITKV